ADGPTHHGTFDLAYLRLIPNMVVMAPKDESELRNMLFTAIRYTKGPVALRYPRGSALGVLIKDGFELLEIGKSEVLLEGDDVALVAVGSMVEYAKEAALVLQNENISCKVINARFVKPLDNNMLDEIAHKFKKIITLEENNLPGGFGSAVAEYFVDKNYKNDILRIGIPDEFVEHGTQQELHCLLKINIEGIVDKVKNFYFNVQETNILA
ncbi:MAG: transketolase C-terminal domain-containing protein, partial [Bacteroidota bacterium]|nr:transketolase C-terminal domain-containing protein [Bacteroidota bacterium]